MNKNLICFGGGLAIGIGATYLYLHDYYNKLLDSETENLKKYYDDRENCLKEASLDSDVEEPEEAFETPKSGENRHKKDIVEPIEPDYEKIVEKLNYNQFSTKPKADNVVESNSENEPTGPYPIDYELYSETTARYTTVLVSYFIEDDIVMYCDSDEMMDDPGKLIGNDNLADLRNNNDLDELYVRNEMMGIDYHIIKEMSSYEEYLAD